MTLFLNSKMRTKKGDIPLIKKYIKRSESKEPQKRLYPTDCGFLLFLEYMRNKMVVKTQPNDELTKQFFYETIRELCLPVNKDNEDMFNCNSLINQICALAIINAEALKQEMRTYNLISADRIYPYTYGNYVFNSYSNALGYFERKTIVRSSLPECRKDDATRERERISEIKKDVLFRQLRETVYIIINLNKAKSAGQIITCVLGQISPSDKNDITIAMEKKFTTLEALTDQQLFAMYTDTLMAKMSGKDTTKKSVDASEFIEQIKMKDKNVLPLFIYDIQSAGGLYLSTEYSDRLESGESSDIIDILRLIDSFPSKSIIVFESNRTLKCNIKDVNSGNHWNYSIRYHIRDYKDGDLKLVEEQSDDIIYRSNYITDVKWLERENYTSKTGLCKQSTHSHVCDISTKLEITYTDVNLSIKLIIDL
jgi:hypothetical protein